MGWCRDVDWPRLLRLQRILRDLTSGPGDSDTLSFGLVSTLFANAVKEQDRDPSSERRGAPVNGDQTPQRVFAGGMPQPPNALPLPSWLLVAVRSSATPLSQPGAAVMGEGQFVEALTQTALRLAPSAVVDRFQVAVDCLPKQMLHSARQTALHALLLRKILPGAMAIGQGGNLSFPWASNKMALLLGQGELVPWSLIYLKEAIRVLTWPSSPCHEALRRHHALLVAVFQQFSSADESEMSSLGGMSGVGPQGAAGCLSYNGVSQLVHDLQIVPCLLHEPAVFRLLFIPENCYI